MSDNKADLLKRVNSTINQLRPYLQSDGGDIEVLDITDENVVQVRLQGACENCKFSFYTLKAGVEQAIRKDIPEIKEVIAI
jgi:Thioredoxin-like proteins and domains